MKIFVTGATGVMGRRIVPLLIGGGHAVTAVARSPDKGAMLARVGARPVHMDLFDRLTLHQAVVGHDVIINLATHMPASTARMLLPGAWRDNDRIRKIVSANLVEAALAAGVERFVQESFAPVYPDCGKAWIGEDTPIAPARYNRTVADAEAAARHFTACGGIGVVLRFASFYGPDAFQLLDMIKLVRRGWAPLPGSPDAYFSSISHDDAATAVVAAIGVREGVYNVADDEPLPRREYVDSLAAALGTPPPRFLPAWLIRLTGSVGELMSRSQRISNGKLRAASGWKPKYPRVGEGWRAILEALHSAAGPALSGNGAAGSSRERDLEVVRRQKPGSGSPAD